MGLAGSLSVGGLFVMGVAAAAPIVVLVGGVTTMYAATGVIAIPIAFLVLAVALFPVTSALVGAARHLCSAATTYAVLANGLGGMVGCAGGAVALLSYTAIGCSLYGLLGSVLASTLGGAWWVWALAAWAVVAGLGGVAVTTNVTLIWAGVVVQVAAVVAVVWSALAHPMAGLDPEGLLPTGLASAGAAGSGGVFAFGIAAFMGYESPASYVEETRSPRMISRAGHLTLVFLGGCYALLAWAVGVGYGPDRVVAAARDPGSGMPLGLLGGYAPLGVLALVVGIGLSLLSFHQLAARYLYRLGVDRVLPARLGGVGSGARAGAPTAASWTQSGLALAVIVAAAVAGADPVVGLFVPASTVAAVGVLALLTGSAWAAGRYFHRGGGDRETWWTRRAAPLLGTATGGGVLAVVVGNLHTLLGVRAGAVATWLLPAAVGMASVLGATRGWWLRQLRPDVFNAIGRGQPRVAARLDPRLADLAL